MDRDGDLASVASVVSLRSVGSKGSFGFEQNRDQWAYGHVHDGSFVRGDVPDPVRVQASQEFSRMLEAHASQPYPQFRAVTPARWPSTWGHSHRESVSRGRRADAQLTLHHGCPQGGRSCFDPKTRFTTTPAAIYDPARPQHRIGGPNFSKGPDRFRQRVQEYDPPLRDAARLKKRVKGGGFSKGPRGFQQMTWQEKEELNRRPRTPSETSMVPAASKSQPGSAQGPRDLDDFRARTRDLQLTCVQTPLKLMGTTRRPLGLAANKFAPPRQRRTIYTGMRGSDSSIIPKNHFGDTRFFSVPR